MSNNVPPSYRGVVLTIGVIIITAAGAYLGAGIKTDNEIRQVNFQFFLFELCLNCVFSSS